MIVFRLYEFRGDFDYGRRERRGGALDERTEPAAVRPRREMKPLSRDGVGIHERAVRRARDSEERAVDDGGRGFGVGGIAGGTGESGTDAKARGIRRVDMLRPVREDWLQTEDIEHVQMRGCPRRAFRRERALELSWFGPSIGDTRPDAATRWA